MASTITTRSATRRFRRLACLLGAGVVAFTCAQAAAVTPQGDQSRISFTGADNDATRDGAGAHVAHNPRAGQHLAVWLRDTPTGRTIAGRLLDANGAAVGSEFAISSGTAAIGVGGVVYNPRANEYMVLFAKGGGALESEAFVRRVSAAGAVIGTDDIRISTMGPDGNANFQVENGQIAYNVTRNEYLAAWVADDARGPLVDEEQEVFVQRLAADGTEVGTDDQRISTMGPNGNTISKARWVTVAYGERHDEYLVAWSGDDTGAILAEDEIYVQRLSGDGAEVGTDDKRISQMGGTGNPAFDAARPSVAYNAATDEYLVAWSSDDNRGGMVDDETEIFVQRLSYDGNEVGTDDQRISDMGGSGSATYLADFPNVVVNSRANEYLVTWAANEDAAPRPPLKVEVHGQRLSATGAEVDGNDIRISNMPDEGIAAAGGAFPYAAYDANGNQYLVAWSGTSSVAPLVPGKIEGYVRRFGAGTPATVAAQQCKVLPALADPPKGDPSKITLSVDQLIINQRIDQAAIRRANGVQSWLDAGVESRDLCQSALGAEELYAGSAGGYTGVPGTYGPPDPRPVQIPAAQPGDPSKVTLTVDQLLINQRISQAAIRRLNALKARLDGGLTGGDIDDGAVGRAQLKAGTTVLYVPLLTSAPAASVTSIAPPSPGDPSKVTLSINQLLINQRISQAAVKRANELIHRLGQGIGPEEVRNGALTAADLAPGLALSTTP